MVGAAHLADVHSKIPAQEECGPLHVLFGLTENPNVFNEPYVLSGSGSRHAYIVNNGIIISNRSFTFCGRFDWFKPIAS
jgi:hypothetical protein